MITYQLTEDEVVAGFLKHRPGSSKVWVRIGIGVVGVLLLFTGYSLPRNQDYRWLGWFAVTVSAFLLIASPFIVRRAYVKAVRNNPIHTAPKEVEFDESGLKFTSPQQKSEVLWSAFRRLTQDEQYFYLHLNDIGGVALLPKRAFAPAELQRFLHCSQNLPKA